MNMSFQWIETAGGPHVLGPAEALQHWRGIDDWRGNAPDDDSDYARACRVKDYLGKIAHITGEIVILSGDVGPIAWVPAEDNLRGVLVQCLASNGDLELTALLRDWEATDVSTRPYTEELTFCTGPSGVVIFFDASESGSQVDIGGIGTIKLLPGRYRLRASYVETSVCVVVLRDLMPIPD
jgi:hypothetical protein